MPYYRVLIWIKHKRTPLQGIRFSSEEDIDKFQHSMWQKAVDMYGFLFEDIETQMLPVNCTAVKMAIKSNRISAPLRKV